jgi:hypothetical protein
MKNNKGKQWLRITSRGEIETEAFTLLGASAKNDENSIGLFGSGAKYAITSLLRNNIEFMVFSGKRRITITTKNVMFRDKHFKQVIVAGKETSLTTRMGSESNDWDNSFAIFRELYSNALDEGGAEMIVTSDIEGVKDKTSIFIDYNDDFKEFFINYNEYFAEKVRPKATIKVTDWPEYHCRILPKGPNKNIRVFRKGILAYHIEESSDSKFATSMFNYDLTNVVINESRVASNMSSTKRKIGLAWTYCRDVNLYREYMKGLEGSNAGTFEHDCIPSEYDTPGFSDELKQFILSKKYVGVEHVAFMNEEPDETWTIMPFAWIKVYMKYLPDMVVMGLNSKGVLFKSAEPSNMLLDNVLEALVLLKETTFDHKLHYINIKYVEFESKSHEALAEDGIVHLSIKLEDRDVNYIAKVIIEEIEHLRTGYGDSTRKFQNHWIDLYFNELTRKATVDG